MFRKTLYIFFLLFWNESSGQTFLNGDFEDNSAGFDQINISNNTYNNYMQNSFAYGNGSWQGGPGDMDIITSSLYGPPQNGSWFVALTGSGTDAISLTLSEHLIVGNTYTISYYDRFSNPQGTYTSFPFQIGLSNANDSFGTLIYSAPNSVIDTWTQRTFTFSAPNNGQYITIQMNGGDLYHSWGHIDHFSFINCNINLNFANSAALCKGDSLILNSTNPSAVYLWQDNSTNAAYTIKEEGTYWVEVTSNICSKRDSIKISVIDCEVYLEMPNVFTPNNDGMNDYFNPTKLKGIDHALLIIYNRWGEKLFETNDISSGWDGKYNSIDCSAGTYFWIIQYTTVTSESKSLKGVLTLI